MKDDEEVKAALRALEEAAQQVREIQQMSELSQLKKDQNNTAEPPLCSFCGKGKNQVRHMIEGKNAFICDECLKGCQDLIGEQ